MSELPAGWRITREYWDTEWSVQQWRKVPIKQGWFRKPVDGWVWKELYTSESEYCALKWAQDTIAAMEAQKEKTCTCSDGQ